MGVYNFFFNHPGIISSTTYVVGMFSMGSAGAVISLPTVLFLAIYDRVRYTPSASRQRILAERCTIVVISTMSCKIFWRLCFPSSPYNISWKRTGICLAYGVAVCIVHFVAARRRESFLRLCHDFQRCPIICLAWHPEEWERYIKQGMPYYEAAEMFLGECCMRDVLEEIKEGFVNPEFWSCEEWDKCERNQLLWLRLMYIRELEESEEKLQDSMTYYLIQKYNMCGMLEFAWLLDKYDKKNLAENRYEEMKNDPFLKSLLKRFYKYGCEIFFLNKVESRFVEAYYQLAKMEKMPSPPWMQSPERVDAEAFNAMSAVEKCAYIVCRIAYEEEENRNWRQASRELRSVIFNYLLGGFAGFLFERVRNNPEFFKGIRVLYIDNLSEPDFLKILEKASEQDRVERWFVAEKLKMVAEQNPDSALAQNYTRMRLLDKYASQGDMGEAVRGDMERVVCTTPAILH